MEEAARSRKTLSGAGVRDSGEDPSIKAPRRLVADAVERGDRLWLLKRVGEVHGHFCPGSAMGVMASVYGMGLLGVGGEAGEGMEDLMAVVEINACFADGVQVVSGCTLGNNALVYRDLGKTAVAFALRGRKRGVRVRVLPSFRDLIRRGAPRFYELLDTVVVKRSGDSNDDAAFKAAGWDAARFIIGQSHESFLAHEWVEPDLPEYATISPTSVCAVCGEEFMATKEGRDASGRSLCRTCAGEEFPEVEGRGIVRRTAPANLNT